jgi:hypothetical protein
MQQQSKMSQAKPLANVNQAMYNLMYEIASELAISPPQSDYWGDLSSRDCGRVGGNITKRLVALGKQQIGG